MTSQRSARSNPRGGQVDGQRLPRLMTVREVADLLAVSETTVYRLKRCGQISFLKVGGGLRFRPEDVEAFQNRQAVIALGYPAKEGRETPRLNLAFPMAKRRGRSI